MTAETKEELIKIYRLLPTPKMIWKTMNSAQLRQELASINNYLEYKLNINQPKNKE